MDFGSSFGLSCLGRTDNAGKVALINSCLSSLPMFLMGFYRLTDGVHAGFDKHRGGFYWNSVDNKRKYRLVKWQLMCKPKNLGGLGIINTRVMNIYLLVKWWWKIMMVGADVLWSSILKAKYYPNSNPMFAPGRRGSQFWKALVKVRPIFLEHVKFCVGNGSAVRFWLDWWSGDAPLAVSFPVLFSYCPNPQISIAEVAANNWDLAFRRALSPEELEECKVFLPSSLCSRRRPTRWFGRLRPLVYSRLNRCTLD